jgi:hypothetical protein
LKSLPLAPLVLAFACAAALSPQGAAAAPHIEFLASEQHLGKMEQNTSKQTTFHFVNSGDAPLVINKTETTCGCTLARATTGAIPPGGSGQVDVTFESRIAFGEVSKPVTIHSNADNPVVVLTIKAFVRTDLYIPKFIQFGAVKRDATLERTIEATGEEGVGFEIVRVETDAPFLRASFEEIPPDPEMGKKYAIRVVMSPGAPPGALTRKVLLHTNLASKPVIEVPVYAAVSGYLATSSDALNFGNFKAGTAKSLHLDLTAGADHPVTVTGVRVTAPHVTARLETIRPGQAYRVVCTVSPSKPAGRLFGTLVVETSDPAEPTHEISLTGFVM